MITDKVVNEVVKERVQIPLAAESLSKERIAYLEGLVSQARTAAAVFTPVSYTHLTLPTIYSV